MQRFLSIALCWFALFALVFATTPSAAVAADGVIFVKEGGISSGACGASWGSACDLQNALQTIAVSGNELWVAAGTYLPTTGADRFATFQLRSGIAVYGGFAGTETARDARSFTTNVTTLSGNIGALDSVDDNVYHVVTGSGASATAVLDGFTITGGNADLYYQEPHYLGAGVFNDTGSPTLSNLIISENTALDFYGSGGGMYNENSSPALNNVTFLNNAVSYDGGGMLNVSSNPTLTNVTFDSNSADGHLCGSGTCGRGGGLTNFSSHPTYTNVTFHENAAHYYGGGIYNAGSSPMTNARFEGNTARFGGGIYGSGSSTMTNVVFDHNTATDYGGGMDTSGNTILQRVTFTGNSAYRGGGMYIYSSAPQLTNVTFSGNSASFGGAITSVTGGAKPVLTNVTITGNSAIYRGGAIEKSGDITGAGEMTIRNSIIWGNTAPEDPQIDEYPVTAVVSDSVVQGGYAGGTRVITTNPYLGAAGDYGGGMLTVPLLPGSSALDAGSAAFCPAADQRGISRAGLAPCDIGAFESRGFTLTKTGGDNQTADTSTAFAAPLSVTISSAYGEPVNGGVIFFSGPASGASTNPAASTAAIAGGAASKSVAANSKGGSYQVRASATSATGGASAPVFFTLTNHSDILNFFLPGILRAP